MRMITKLFKDAKIKIALKTTNGLKGHHNSTDK
jgi:hypothetical protein